MTKDKALDLAQEALENNRRTHYYCEDTWYSCPKHEDGCANEAEGDECNCGADKANQEIDNAITAIKQARSAPVQESEKRECMNCAAFGECNPNNDAGRCGYEPPAAQRQWVGLTQQDIDIAFDDTQEGGGFNEFAHAIEAKLKEKNNG